MLFQTLYKKFTTIIHITVRKKSKLNFFNIRWCYYHYYNFIILFDERVANMILLCVCFRSQTMDRHWSLDYYINSSNCFIYY